MKRSLSLALALTMLLSLMSVAYGFGPIQQVFPIFTQPSAETGEAVNETPQLWFIEFNGAPTADGGRLPAIALEKRNFRAEAATAKIRFKERYSFDTLWNGISIAITPEQLPALTRLNSVKALYPIDVISVPETQTSATPEMFTALSMTGADIAQSELGYTGKNVKVAIMDTGIDYMHPDLGGGFGPGFKVFTGWDFVGDAFNADPSSAGYNPVPKPGPDPMDTNGHGTHVAGIAGANGTVIGVAPDALLGAYRVFGTEGSTTADIMLAAMERVLADKMDVLNMSIGAAFQWPNYPTAQAADRLVNKGIAVVASIGNSGTNGLYAAGAPGLGEKVIGVASFDNTHVTMTKFIVNPGAHDIYFAPATAAPPPPTEGTFEMARTGTKTSVADAADPLPEGSLAGKVALIRRGTASFYIKALNAQNAGAMAVVLYNNSAGRFSPTVAGDPPITIPVVAISKEEGELIDDLLAAGELAEEPVTITWTDVTGTFLNPTGGLISSFSSYGLSPDLTLKPDIGAPGGLIYSTYPLGKGAYATISGTSMSSPHVAGAVALLLEAKPNTRAETIRGILQNSADPKPWWGNPGSGFLDNAHRQGAGMLDIAGAISAQTSVTPSKLSLGESVVGPHDTQMVIVNESANPITYTLNHLPALSTGPNTFTPTFHTGFASVAVDVPELTISAGASAQVNVSITANPALADGSMYGGYLVINGSDGSVLRVPYAGYKGDYKAKPVLTPTIYGFPWLSVVIEGEFHQFMEYGDWVYSMNGDDIPYFLVHLDHHSTLLRADLLSAKNKRPIETASEYDYLPRNSTSTGFFALPWDGIVGRGKSTVLIPNGDYLMRLSVLKALGNPDNPDHWETWESPIFSIKRDPSKASDQPGGKPPVPPGQGKK